MLFHVTHVHTSESCPAHDPELLRNTIGKIFGSAEQIGVKLVGSYVDAPAHTIYFIVETDAVDKLKDLFDPLLNIGHTEIRPVVDGLASYKKRVGES